MKYWVGSVVVIVDTIRRNPLGLTQTNVRKPGKRPSTTVLCAILAASFACCFTEANRSWPEYPMSVPNAAPTPRRYTPMPRGEAGSVCLPRKITQTRHKASHKKGLRFVGEKVTKPGHSKSQRALEVIRQRVRARASTPSEWFSVYDLEAATRPDVRECPQR